ncbi:MAG: hypothetical protein LBV60_13810, partial [Streptomyces sp.]|nr:hypothetical protein [Streptomyces sp.]
MSTEAAHRWAVVWGVLALSWPAWLLVDARRERSVRRRLDAVLARDVACEERRPRESWVPSDRRGLRAWAALSAPWGPGLVGRLGASGAVRR